MKIDTIKSKVITGLCTITTLIAIAGGVYWFITSVAMAEDVKQLRGEFYQYVISGEIRGLQQRLWDIEDRYGKDPNLMPAEWRQEYRCIQEDMIKQKDKMKTLKGE